MPSVITILTDFGTADGYLAEMKGVLLTLAPTAQLVDASNDIPPQDIELARLTLARYWRRYPSGTVHLVVVDPGVGSERRAIAVRSDDRFLVGPDNGVLSPALLLPRAEAVVLPVPRGVSATFHGRDIFAPAAALLVSGTPLSSLGSPCPDPVIRRTPEVVRIGDGIVRGEVIAVDRFGNLITNLVTGSAATVEIGPHLLPLQRSYSFADAGALVALTGSSGLIEIAVRDGNAAMRLGVGRGTTVMLRSVTRD